MKRDSEKGLARRPYGLQSVCVPRENMGEEGLVWGGFGEMRGKIWGGEGMGTECGDYDRFCAAGDEFAECFWESKIPADE